MKTCTKCSAEKGVGDFYAHPKSADGLMSKCKDCHKDAVKLRRRTDPAVQEYDRRRYHDDPARKARTAEIARRWNERNPEGYRAHYAVTNAVRDGRLKKLPCEICGTTKSVHGHHDDYSKPLDVRWLCPTHHQLYHAEEDMKKPEPRQAHHGEI